MASQHKIKVRPPTYNGSYTTFEEWKYKFKAYMGVQHEVYPRFLEMAEQSGATYLTQQLIREAASTLEEAEEWVQLDNNLKYILVIITEAAAATICRQYQQECGLEIYRQICNRFSTPLGTRSIGYLTKLLKPTFDSNNFEESFCNWEYELQRYEHDNSTTLPDQVKIAVLMNETKGALQQHLHLNAGATPTYTAIRTTIMEYYRATTALARLQQQQNPSSSVSTNYNGGTAPMDIGAIGKGKYKGKGKGKHKGKGKGKGNNKGSFKGKGKGYNNNYYKGKSKGKIGQQQPAPQKGIFKGSPNKGKGQYPTGKGACYRCGGYGHIAKDCNVPVYNIQQNDNSYEQYTDQTQQWYDQPQHYDTQWWSNDQSHINASQHPHQPQQQITQLALPAPSTDGTPTLHIAMINTETVNTAGNTGTPEHSFLHNHIMIDSGAATHVCPPWFAPNTPLHVLQQDEGPNLRAANNDPIHVHGYKWVYMRNKDDQQLVIPFYVCDVSQAIMSVTRLNEQGYNIHFTDSTPDITHPTGFKATLTKTAGLYYLPVKTTLLPPNTRLDIRETTEGFAATISPVTLTPQGPVWVTHNNDIWMYNNQGFLVRLHRRQRKAVYMPDQHCPVPMDQLENYRRTIARKADGSTEDFEEQLHDLQQGQTKRPLLGPAWTGETWFKVKKDTKPPKPRPPPTATLTTSPGILPSTASSPTAPATRHTIKKPLDTVSTPKKDGQQPAYVPQSTSIPKPKEAPDTTGDYWIKEGHMWKRVHQQPRTDLYIPQQTHDGPDVTKLTPERTTFVTPTNGNRQYRIDDDWTTKTKATLNIPWTGSTNFEESTAYKDEYYTIEEEEQQQAIPAKGIRSPEQPTQQERAEHNLTHLPFRSWCPLCVQSKGKADAHKQQKQTSTTPVLQFDFCYFKTLGETKTTPILTGIDVETGMAMAVVTDNKSGDFTYHVQAIQAFLLECGRVQATLNSTVLQSDQEDHLIALLKATAAKMGGNITVRQSPAYSSQSQGSVERFHRTLMGQVRTLKAQLEHNYNIRITSQHPIMPWLVRHSVYLLNRYAVHADGNTSFFRRWNKKHQSPLCEFGETVQYQLPTHKDLPKLEPRFMPAIWLGKDTASGETLLGIANKVIRARTIRRQPHPEKYNKQLMDTINNNGLAKFATGGPALTQPPVFYKPLRREQTTAETQTLEAQPTTTRTTSTLPTASQPALPFSPMATSPTSYHTRPALPSPTSASKRSFNDEIAQGSEAKQQRTDTQTVGPARPETAVEPPSTKQRVARISAVTVATKKGTHITAQSCEDPTEAITEHILLEPIVNNTDGLDKQKTIEGMKKEIEQMKAQQVYTEVSYNTLTPEQQTNIIQSRWVLRDKGNTVRARIVAKGYTETISDMDDIYASTPIFCVLRLLLTLSINNGWTIQTGDISVAFLHALAATSDLYMYPPTEFYTPDSGVIWKLNKAIYGLRSSPKAWQAHLAETLQHLGLHRSTAEPNVYFTTSRDCYILVYVDDLMFLGVDNTINKIFGAIQQHLMLRSTGALTPGNTVAFLGRNITNMGDHYEISLADSYTTNLLEDTSLSNCKPATTPGTSALKTATAEQEQKLNHEEHSAFRRAVGKLQWMTYTRPDISYATKELARSLQEPTTADQQKLKHLLRYIKGNEHYKQIIRPTIKVPESTVPDFNIYVDSDWAGCHVTRKSTTGFVITMLGATINYGSRTQATIALSSAEAELYAINTGATEALHLRGLCEELTNIKKINIRIHTDSSSGKSMATRIGTSRKAKHIELRHLFIQQLVALDIVRIIKIHTNNNPADILTKYVSAETLQRHLNNVGLHIQHQ